MLKSKLRLIVLVLITLVFLASSVASWYSNNQSSRLVATHVQLSSWSLSLLELESRKLYNNLRLYRAGAISFDEVALTYDLLWNRLSIFLVSDESKRVRQSYGAGELAERIFDVLKEHEQRLEQMKKQPPQAEGMIAALQPLLDDLRVLMIKVNTGPEAKAAIEAIFASQQKVALLLMGLFITGLMLLMALIRENQRNKSLSLHDPLTGLPNRTYFRQQLANWCQESQRHQPRVLCLLNLNRFKDVNDTLGYSFGDQILVGMAKRLREIVQEGDMIARLDGNEFALILQTNPKEESVESQVRRLCESLSIDFMAEGKAYHLEASVGVSLFPDYAKDADKLYVQAELALQHARQKGRNKIAVYSPIMASQLQRSRRLLKDLRSELANPESTALQMYYQPIVSSSNQHSRGMEALLRWSHPELGPVSPMEAVEIAENNELGHDLAAWVLQRVAKELHRLPSQVRDQLYVAINLSPSLFNQNLPQWMTERVNALGLAPQQLVLEITENILMLDMRGCQTIIERLRALGYRLALDDFGTGYSSLSYLRSLPINTLKIDKSFIRSLQHDPLQQFFVQSMVELAHRLGARVVAEGIESAPEHECILKLNCDEAQGYFYGHPMPMQALLPYLSLPSAQTG